jgi:hypothetical protein
MHFNHTFEKKVICAWATPQVNLKLFQKVANQNVRTLQKLCKMSLNAFYNFYVFVLSVKRQCTKMCNQEKGKEHGKTITTQLTRS